MAYNNEKSSPRVTRSGAKSALSLSRAVEELKRNGRPVTQTIHPQLRLRDALFSES